MFCESAKQSFTVRIRFFLSVSMVLRNTGAYGGALG